MFGINKYALPSVESLGSVDFLPGEKSICMKLSYQIPHCITLTRTFAHFMCPTCELTVVVGACRVLLVWTEGRTGRGAGAEAGVAEGRAHLTGLAAVVDWPLDVEGGGQRGALLRLRQDRRTRGSRLLFKIHFNLLYFLLFFLYVT